MTCKPIANGFACSRGSNVGKGPTPESLAAPGTEDAEQAALFCWAAQYANETGDRRLLRMFAIPNGGYRDKREAAKLKTTGTRAGVPDTFLPIAVAPWYGLFIELKTAIGETSERQDDWIGALRDLGYGVAVCRGWESARETILSYLAYKA